MWKISLCIIITCLLGIIFLAWYTFGQRTQTQVEEIIISPTADETVEVRDTQSEPSSPTETPDEDLTADPEKEIPHENVPEKKSAYHITRTDCDNECQGFTENTAGWRYCASICGIIKPKETEANCDTKTGLSRDYCLSNQAFKENTPSLCEDITDRGIAQKCSTQIIERAVDGF